MKTIVIYNSQTGFTRRYAQWIAEAAGADCLELSAAKKKRLDAYEAIVFGSWACAGGMQKIGWFKHNIGKWADKKLIVFCVGASPMDSPDIDPALRHNFTESEFKKNQRILLPGRIELRENGPLGKAYDETVSENAESQKGQNPG